MTTKAKAPPKKRDREATTRKLLQAGLEVFSRWGYDGATTRMISKKAGLAEALIIRYFGSKEGLLISILVSYLEKLRNSEQHYPEGKTVEEEITHFLFHQFERDLAMKDFLRVVLSRATVDSKFNRKIREQVPTECPPLLLERLQAFQKRGLVSLEVDLSDVGFALGFQAFATLYVGHMLLDMDPAEIRQRLLSFARTYAAGLAKA